MNRVETILNELPDDVVEKLRGYFRSGKPAQGVLFLRHHYQIGINDGMMVMASDLVSGGTSLPETEIYHHGDSVKQVAQYLQEQPDAFSSLVLQTECDSFYMTSWVFAKSASLDSAAGELLYTGRGGQSRYEIAEKLCVELSAVLGIPWEKQDF